MKLGDCCYNLIYDIYITFHYFGCLNHAYNSIYIPPIRLILDINLLVFFVSGRNFNSQSFSPDTDCIWVASKKIIEGTSLLDDQLKEYYVWHKLQHTCNAHYVPPDTEKQVSGIDKQVAF